MSANFAKALKPTACTFSDFWHNHPMPTNPDTHTTKRRVIRPTSEQMLKAMAQAADEQSRVSVAAGTTATQKPREGALKSVCAVVLAGLGNEEKAQ